MNKRTEKESKGIGTRVAGAEVQYEEEPRDYQPLISHRSAKTKSQPKDERSQRRRPIY
jgi:hypothetical protein